MTFSVVLFFVLVNANVTRMSSFRHGASFRTVCPKEDSLSLLLASGKYFLPMVCKDPGIKVTIFPDLESPGIRLRSWKVIEMQIAGVKFF